MKICLAMAVSVICFSICISCAQGDSQRSKVEIKPPKQPNKLAQNDAPNAREALEKRVRTMFENKQFAELDILADEFRTSKSRFPDGVWKLQTFINSFELPTESPEAEFIKSIKLAEEWRAAHPSSVTAQSVLAMAWVYYAWNARGGGYASDVKPEMWPLFEERIDKAWKIINEPLANNVSDCPNRHSCLLRLAIFRGVDSKAFESLFSEAVRQEPGYYPHYVAKADYLLPKWHGEEGDWQKYITKVAKQYPQKEGATIYTRVAWIEHSKHNWDKFERSGISWDRMKAGFVEINHNYPGSYWNINWFAKFACLAKDKETLTELLKQIDTGVKYNNAWLDINMDDCRDFATGLTLPKSPQERIFRDILRSGEQGDRRAFTALGSRYLYGNGTQADPVAAYAWLAQNESENKELLTETIKVLSAVQLQQAKQKAEELRRRLSQYK